MIERLLPAEVQCADSFGDVPESFLLPGEEVFVSRATAPRRREFTTTRHLARQALSQLGHDTVALPRGERGAPVWPVEVIGSMTHCDGYRAAVVASATPIHVSPGLRPLRSLGIDAEPNRALPDGVLEAIAMPKERERLAALARRHPSIAWDRLLFCAKEAVYKTWFPLTGAWLDFEDVWLTFHPVQHTFSAAVLRSGLRQAQVTGLDLSLAPRALAGRWTVGQGFILTAIAHPGCESPIGSGGDCGGTIAEPQAFLGAP